MNGSLLVVEASSIEEAKRIVEGDAFYSNNVVRSLSPRLAQGVSLTWPDSGTRRR